MSMSGLYHQQNFSPSRAPSSQIRPTPETQRTGLYLVELLEEHQKLVPFVQVLPICSRLLNQEIFRVSGHLPNQNSSEWDIIQRGSMSPMRFSGANMGGLNALPQEIMALNSVNSEWLAPPASPSYISKKVVRLDIPVGSYPNFNFVGRILGPRGNSLKRVEATTGCRVFIRGKGSIKDPEKEEALRGRPGYEHLSESLHILIEAELPANLIDLKMRQAQEIIEELLKPVDETQDIYKRQQLRELAMLNGEESPRPSGNASPLISTGMKRAKTGQ